MSAVQDPPQAPPQLTPKGTSIVLVPASPGQPQQTAAIPPELVPLFRAAVESMPPGALKTLLVKNWGYVVALLVPLVLTTYTNLKEIWSGPANLAAIKATYDTDHKAVEDNVKAVEGVKVQLDVLQKKVEANDVKVDKILWIMQQGRPGPTSGPINY